MAFFARSPKKKPSPKKYAKDWKAESDAETDAAARLNKIMAKLEGITPERDEKSLEAAYALTQAVADVSLGDVWSEIRRACARGVARVPLDGPRRARLAAVFSGQLRVTTDWRRPAGCARLSRAWRRTSRRRPARRSTTRCWRPRRRPSCPSRSRTSPRPSARPRARSAPSRSAASAEAAERLLGAVGAALTAALEAQAAEGGADGKRPPDAAAPTPDRERRAAALAGLLGGAARLVPRARASALESGGLVDVGRLAGLLAHDASTLAFSTARADFAFDALGPPGAGGLGFLVDPAVPPSHRALGARLLAHGVSFGRFCDEALADAECTPLFRKWGLSHEGAGGDSEAVSKAEAAVRDAARARPAALRRRVGALRLAVLGAVPRLAFRRRAAAAPRAPARVRGAAEGAAGGAAPRRRGLAFCAAAARGAPRPSGPPAARGAAFEGGDAALHGAADWPLLRLAPAETRRLAEPALAELPLAACADRALGGLFRAVSFRGAADDLSPRKRKAGVARAVVADVPPGAPAAAGGGGAAAFVARSLADRLVGAKGRKDADLSARLLGALALAALLSASRRVFRPSPSAEDPPDDWDDWDDDDDAPDCGGGDEDDDALDAERALTAAIDAEAAKDGRRPPFCSSFEPGAATSAGKPLLPSLAFF
ncbi:hypothetical protein JL720_1090 [Aureococcus anophagefferens]|nr:hypothetical protein JL720_1090 [Aureococcus anophagefferens]